MNNEKQKNARELGYSIGFVLNVKDNLTFKNQKVLFNLLNASTQPNSHGAYEILNTKYFLWFPNLYSTDDEWNNEISADCTEIYEHPKKGNKKKLESTAGKLAIVFGKYKNYCKFIGVFTEIDKKVNKVKYKKISDVVVLNKY